jgi:hypothetical protein
VFGELGDAGSVSGLVTVVDLLVDVAMSTVEWAAGCVRGCGGAGGDDGAGRPLLTEQKEDVCGARAGVKGVWVGLGRSLNRLKGYRFPGRPPMATDDD